MTLPVLQRLRDGTIQSFRPLARMDDDEFERLLIGVPMFNRRLEWLALGCGVAGGLLLWRPWDDSVPVHAPAPGGVAGTRGST